MSRSPINQNEKETEICQELQQKRITQARLVSHQPRDENQPESGIKT